MILSYATLFMVNDELGKLMTVPSILVRRSLSVRALRNFSCLLRTSVLLCDGMSAGTTISHSFMA